MKKVALYCITALLICLTSCEGSKSMSVIVVSANNGNVIPGTAINVLNGIGDSTVTDSLGRFMIKTGFTGMMFGDQNLNSK